LASALKRAPIPGDSGHFYPASRGMDHEARLSRGPEAGLELMASISTSKSSRSPPRCPQARWRSRLILAWVAPGCRIPFQMALARAETLSRAPPCPRAHPSCPWDRGKGAPTAGVPKAPRGSTPSKRGEGPRLAPAPPVLALLGGKNLPTPAAGGGKARAPGSQSGKGLEGSL
jgi:hypothetical protein